MVIVELIAVICEKVAVGETAEEAKGRRRKAEKRYKRNGRGKKIEGGEGRGESGWMAERAIEKWEVGDNKLEMVGGTMAKEGKGHAVE